MQKKIYVKQGLAFEGFTSTFTRSSSLSKVLIFFFILFVALGAGVYGYKDYQKRSKAQPVVTVTPTPSLMPTETPMATPSGALTGTPPVSKTPSPALSKTTSKKIPVAVLNGSGTPGVAKTASDLLTGLGYEVVTSGNADSFDYTGVTILIKKSKKQFLATLSKDLGSKYTVGSSSATLSESSEEDAQIIIGE